MNGIIRFINHIISQALPITNLSFSDRDQILRPIPGKDKLSEHHIPISCVFDIRQGISCIRESRLIRKLFIRCLSFRNAGFRGDGFLIGSFRYSRFRNGCFRWNGFGKNGFRYAFYFRYDCRRGLFQWFCCIFRNIRFRILLWLHKILRCIRCRFFFWYKEIIRFFHSFGITSCFRHVRHRHVNIVCRFEINFRFSNRFLGFFDIIHIWFFT